MKWRGIALLLSIVASTSSAQTSSYDGEWQGKYSCGPALHRTGPGTAAFSVNVTLRVNGTKAAMVREDAAAREITEGMVTADGALGLQGTGRLTAGNSAPWRTRFEGKFQGSAFSATGVIDSTNGATKFRECTLALQRSSPAKAAAQIQPSAATDRPPTVAAVPQNPASASTAPESKPTTGGTGSAGKAAQVTIPATGVKTPDVVAVPPLTARVTDLTNTLSSSQRQSLEAALAAFEKKNGSQIAVLMLPSTQPETIEQYSMRVADRWRIGRAKVDDGVILVIAKNDQHLRIEVGSGLEGAIPNMKAKRIIREVIAPRLKEGDFFGGIRDGSNELMSLVESASLATGGERVGRQSTKAKASPTVPAATQAQSTVTTPSQAPTQSTDLPGPESKGKDLAAVEALATPRVTSTRRVEPANQAPLPRSESTAESVPKAGSIESGPSAAGERALLASFDSKALLLAALAGAGIVGLVVFVVARLRRRSTTRPSEKHTAADKSAVPPVDDLQSGLVHNKTKLVEGAQALSHNAAGILQQAAVNLTEHPPSPLEAQVRDGRHSALAAEHPTEKAAQIVIKHELTSRSVEDNAARQKNAADTASVVCVVEPDQQNSELPDLPLLQHESGPNPSPRDSIESVSTSVHGAEKMESKLNPDSTGDRESSDASRLNQQGISTPLEYPRRLGASARQTGTNEIVISASFPLAFQQVSEAIQRLGSVKYQDKDQQFVEARIKHGLQSVKVRASLVERSPGETTVVIQASSDDVWKAGAKSATKRLVETLLNLDNPGYRPDRLGMHPGALIGGLLGFLLVVFLAIKFIHPLIFGPISVPSCDGSNVLQLANKIIRDNNPLVEVGPIQMPAESGFENLQRFCRGVVMNPAGGQIIVNYSVSWHDKSKGVIYVEILN